MDENEFWEKLSKKETLTKEDVITVAHAIAHNVGPFMSVEKRDVLVRIDRDKELMAFMRSDEFRTLPITPPPVKKVVTFNLLTTDIIRERIDELQKLTMGHDDSDMNRTLRAVRDGTSNVVTAFSAEFEGKLVGWSIIDCVLIALRRKTYFLDVFVQEDFRGKGIGTRLVDSVLRMFQQGFPDTELIRDREPEGFWEKFPRTEHL